MAFHTLPMIGCHQSGFERILGVKGPAVAANTIGWFFCRRAVVVATLADCTLFVVEIIRQFVIFDVIEQCVDNFTVRKLYRFILIRQGLDDDRLRNILVIINCGNGITGFKGLGGQPFLLLLLNLIGNPGCWHHVAICTGGSTLLALFFKGRMAPGTDRLI